MEDYFNIWLCEKEFQRDSIFTVMMLQLEEEEKLFNHDTNKDIALKAGGSCVDVMYVTCRVCWMEVVHKSEGGVHREASGAGDVRL